MTTNGGSEEQKPILSILETKRLRSRCLRAGLPPEAPGEDPSRLFQLLEAPGVPGLVATSVQSPSPSSRGLSCVCPLLSLLRTPVTGFRATLIRDDLISRSVNRVFRSYFQTRSHSQVLGGQDVDITFGGGPFNPYRSPIPRR